MLPSAPSARSAPHTFIAVPMPSTRTRVLGAVLASAVACNVALLPGEVARLPADEGRAHASSDALLGALGQSGLTARVDALAATLPLAPGVVVAREPGEGGALVAAYQVIATRVRPRAVAYVTCAPGDGAGRDGDPAAVRPAWRLDIDAGVADPVVRNQTLTDLCGAGGR